MRFYYPNEIVSTPNGIARVVHHNYYTHMVHVLRSVNKKTWVMEKFDESKIEEGYAFILTTGQIFKSKFASYVQYYRYF